jgi:hypothetical protein
LTINSLASGNYAYLDYTGTAGNENVSKVNVNYIDNAGTTIAAGADSILSYTVGWTNDTGKSVCGGGAVIWTD